MERNMQPTQSARKPKPIRRKFQPKMALNSQNVGCTRTGVPNRRNCKSNCVGVGSRNTEISWMDLDCLGFQRARNGKRYPLAFRARRMLPSRKFNLRTFSIAIRSGQDQIVVYGLEYITGSISGNAEVGFSGSCGG